MLIGALLDLGAPLDGLREDLARLGVAGFSIRAERTWRGGLAGTHFQVTIDPGARPPRRNLPAILALIRASGLPPPVIADASRVFERLGAAEAKVHGCAIEEVHFHEVGAIDSIADIVGFCALHQRLGRPPLYASPIAVGEGFVATEHGKLPVPAMATLELLAGVPCEGGGLQEELCTPTGAALLSTLCSGFGRGFAYIPRKVGYGLGTRERASPPNAVRVIECEQLEPPAAAAGNDDVVVIETNLDDTTGQEIGRLIELCLARGALDVAAFPVVMKKGRPGHVLQVLAAPAYEAALAALLFAESPTLGVRCSSARRRILAREACRMQTSLGEVRVKIATLSDGVRRAAAEFDDLCRIAVERALALPEVRRRVQTEIDAELARAPSSRQ